MGFTGTITIAYVFIVAAFLSMYVIFSLVKHLLSLGGKRGKRRPKEPLNSAEAPPDRPLE